MTEAWFADAACLDDDTNRWFYSDGLASHSYAKQVCGGCPVREPCLEYALDHSPIAGVWGGLTETERRRLPHRKRTA